MPIYNFKCKSTVCGVTQEHITPYSKKTVDCKECESTAHRVFSANSVAFRVNGAGAYDSGKFKNK